MPVGENYNKIESQAKPLSQYEGKSMLTGAHEESTEVTGTILTATFNQEKPSRLPGWTIIVVLICIIWVNFGSYYIFDVPQQLAGNFMEQFKINPESIALLYSLYAIPAMPMAFVGGFMVSWLTPMITIMLTTFCVFLSTIITYYGVSSNQYIYIMAGRVLQGFVGEVNQVCQNTIIGIWFTGRYLSIATGLTQAVNSLSMVGSNLLTGRVYYATRNLNAPFFVAALWCFLSLSCAVVYAAVDLVYYPRLKEEKLAKLEAGKGSDEEQAEAQMDHRISFKMLKDLKNPLIWTTIFNFVSGILLYFMFNNMADELLIKRYNFKLIEAQNLVTGYSLISVIFVPFYSTFAVKKGYKSLMMVIAFSLGTVAYILMAFLPEKKTFLHYVFAFLLGQFWAIFNSCSWSCLVLVSPTRSLSMVLGTNLLFANAFVASLSPVFGNIVKADTAQSYQNGVIGLVVLGVICILNSLVVFFIDKKRGGLLYRAENSEEVTELRKKINMHDD